MNDQVNDETITEELMNAADEIMGGEPVTESREDEGKAAEAQDAGTPAEPSDSEQLKAEVSETDVKAQEDEATGAEGAEDGEPPKAEAEGKEATGPEDEDKAATGEEEEDLLTPPEGLSDRAKERFETLVERLQEREQEIRERDQVIDGFRQILDQTGLDNEELARVLDIGAMIKHDPAQALEELQAITRELARQVGKPIAGASTEDLLEGFDDLKEAVENLEITEEAALELAAARRQRQQWEEQQRRFAETQQGQQLMEQERRQAEQQVVSVLAEIEKDIDFPALAEELEEAARYAGENLAPSQWAGYIQSEFSRLKRLAEKARNAGNGSRPVPISEGGSRGGAEKVPQTLEELADQML